MLIGKIRSTETHTVDVEGGSLEEIAAALESHRPEGFDLTNAPVAMAKASKNITATGTFSRRDGVQEIAGESMDALQAQVPEGWRLLHVRRS